MNFCDLSDEKLEYLLRVAGSEASQVRGVGHYNALHFDDARSAALLGICWAMKTFDPKAGVPLENYCGIGARSMARAAAQKDLRERKKKNHRFRIPHRQRLRDPGSEIEDKDAAEWILNQFSERGKRLVTSVIMNGTSITDAAYEEGVSKQAIWQCLRKEIGLVRDLVAERESSKNR